MLNLFPLSFLLILLWQAKLCRGKGNYHRDYLSREHCSSIKGALSLVILLHHLGQSIMTGGGGRGSLLLLFAHIGGILPVAMFFFYSGYSLQKKYMCDQEYARYFLLKRLPMVLIPYLSVTLLYWLQSYLLGQPYTLQEVLRSFYSGFPIVRFSWFILALLCFYFVFFLLMKLCKTHFSAMVLGALLYCAVWRWICIRAQIPPYWYSSIHVLAVGMGWAVWENKITGWLQKYGWLGISIPVAAFLLIAPISHFGAQNLNELVVVCFVLAAASLLTKIQFFNPILRFIGGISFEIYLLQGLFLTGLRNSGFYLNNGFLFCLLVISGTLLAAWGAHLVFRTILRKYRNFLSRRLHIS